MKILLLLTILLLAIFVLNCEKRNCLSEDELRIWHIEIRPILPKTPENATEPLDGWW